MGIVITVGLLRDIPPSLAHPVCEFRTFRGAGKVRNSQIEARPRVTLGPRAHRHGFDGQFGGVRALGPHETDAQQN